MATELPYHAQLPFTFGALEQDAGSFDRARAVVLPVPFERTTSYVPGTKNGPREIIAASGQVELYDEELGREICDVGIHTLPAMESPFASTDDAFAEMRRVAGVAGRGREVLRRAGRRTRAHGAARRRCGRRAPGRHRAADRRARRPARELHGRPAQPRERHATRPGVRAGGAGGHPQPVRAGSGGDSGARDHRVLRLEHAQRSGVDHARRRGARREGLHHDRLRRARPGHHARRRHAGAWRA